MAVSEKPAKRLDIQVKTTFLLVIWSEVTNFIDFTILEKYIKTINLEELLNIFPNILKGEIAGRVLVDLNK